MGSRCNRSSAGQLTTKIHALVVADDAPIHLKLPDLPQSASGCELMSRWPRSAGIRRQRDSAHSRNVVRCTKGVTRLNDGPYV